MWLYVPGTSSASAQASEDLNSASCSPSDIGERMGAVYVTWRGKQQQPQAWSRRWRQGGFIRRLSGLTCEPSTLDHGVASFISSLRAIPAKTTASPESGQGQTESASLPPKSPALPKSAGLILSSARTCRGTQTDSLQPSLRHWKGWATALRQEYSARPPLATPCGASDCSSWPSAKTVSGSWERDRNGNVYPTLEGAAINWPGPDATNRVRDEETLAKCAAFRLRNAGQKTVPLYLAEVAQEWMAPQVPNGGRSTNHAEQVGATLYHNGKKVQMGLEAQTKQWSAPAAQNHKGSSEGSILRADGKSRDDLLHYQAEQFFHPPSSPDQPIAGGSMSSTDSPNSNQPSVKRKLNPIFVEALMRWPTGLSGFERQEMVSIPSLLPMHFCVCRKGSKNAETDDRYPGEGLSAVRSDDEPTAASTCVAVGSEEVVQQGMHGDCQSAEGTGLRTMREDVHPCIHEKAGPSVLLDPVRQRGEVDQGAVSQDAGRGEGPHGASGGEGAGDWSPADAGGSRAPCGREQAQQRSVEPRNQDELAALARAHERQPTCEPLSAIDIWWLLMPSFLSALYSASEVEEQMELFGAAA